MNGLEALARYLWSKWSASCEYGPSDGCLSWEDLNWRQQSYWFDRAQTMVVELIPPEMVVVLRADVAALAEYYESRQGDDSFGQVRRRQDAADVAITPELLARVKEATR